MSNKYQYHAFLNHNGRDTKKVICTQLKTKLENIGFSVFLDQTDMDVGSSNEELLINAVKTTKYFIAILSENFFESKWCIKELELAKQLMDQKKTTIIPVFIDYPPKLCPKEYNWLTKISSVIKTREIGILELINKISAALIDLENQTEILKYINFLNSNEWKIQVEKFGNVIYEFEGKSGKILNNNVIINDDNLTNVASQVLDLCNFDIETGSTLDKMYVIKYITKESQFKVILSKQTPSTIILMNSVMNQICNTSDQMPKNLSIIKEFEKKMMKFLKEASLLQDFAKMHKSKVKDEDLKEKIDLLSELELKIPLFNLIDFKMPSEDRLFMNSMLFTCIVPLVCKLSRDKIKKNNKYKMMIGIPQRIKANDDEEDLIRDVSLLRAQQMSSANRLASSNSAHYGTSAMPASYPNYGNQQSQNVNISLDENLISDL